MLSDDVVIDLAGISKVFASYEKPSHRLAQTLLPRIRWALPERVGRRIADRHRAREFWALRDIDIRVKRGDALGIIGRNGSGKSTLLQIIAGTLAPTSGNVRVKGRVAALLELGSGFNPDFTGRENVILNGMILGLSEREVRARFDAIIDFADIGAFIDQPVRTYSSGMMLRLAFAVQTQIEPDVLIVDEALAVGDALFQKRCFQQMESLRANGCTLLFVSHDQESIRTLTDHAVLLRDGAIRCAGPSSEVVLEYRKDLHEDERAYYAAVTARRRVETEPADQHTSPDLPSGNGEVSTANENGGKSVVDEERVERSDTLSFGDLDCVIESVSVRNENGDECAYFLPGDRVIVDVTARPKHDLEHINVNLRIRNKEGVKMYSWGTLNQDVTGWSAGRPSGSGTWNRSFRAGVAFTTRFAFDCTLGMNFYEVQASVSEELDRYGGAQRMLHWRDEAAFFQVGVRQKEYTFGGVCDLRMSAEILSPNIG